MEWTPGGESNDIEDRRDQAGGGGGGGFGFGGGGFGGIHLGIGGFLLLLIGSWIFHVNLFSLVGGGGGQPLTSDRSPATNRELDAAESTEVKFISFVLDDVQKTWTTLLPDQAHLPYRHAKLVLYRDVTQAGCGAAQSATGPFYCPEDEKVYLDLGFFNELSTKFGAPGQFAQAYVVAHELGHHVQKIVGTEAKVTADEQRDRAHANQYSVRLELQADCYAGVWGHTAQQRSIINADDISQGLAAAASVGDDRLQKMARGSVSPETFTHGSSAQRTEWFKRGLDSGQISSCNTFQ